MPRKLRPLRKGSEWARLGWAVVDRSNDELMQPKGGGRARLFDTLRGAAQYRQQLISRFGGNGNLAVVSINLAPPYLYVMESGRGRRRRRVSTEPRRLGPQDFTLKARKRNPKKTRARRAK